MLMSLRAVEFMSLRFTKRGTAIVLIPKVVERGKV